MLGNMSKRCRLLAGLTALLFATTAWAQAPTPAPGLHCAPVTAGHATASAGTPNINHDGTAIPGIPKPDISQGFRGIPRSAQPALTPSQRRILECTYRLPEANAAMPFTLFVPTTYRPATASALIVDLHGLGITPLAQILFDGTVDFAERHGFIVLAPMGFSVSGWWGARAGDAVEASETKADGLHYTTGELSELDAMTVLTLIRDHYTIDADRIFLMGHSMGGAGVYYLGAKHPDIWAGLAAISGAGGIRDAAAADAYKAIPFLIMHGAKDSIVPPAVSRRSVAALQAVGAPHVYLEFPGMDHEFWIRRGADHLEKVFLFFSMLSKRTTVGFVTPEMETTPAPGGGR